MTGASGRISLWGIEVFAATAEEGSISAAARRLGASASAVSQQITNLETALGAQLMDRAARPLRLTPAGEIFRRRAAAILSEADMARSEMAGGGEVALTRLGLGVIEDFEAAVTPQLLARMAGALGGFKFELETGASHLLYDRLDAGAMDVIVAAEMGAPARWTEMHPVLTEQFVVAAPRGAVPAGADPLEALQALPLVQYTARHHMGRQIAGHLARQNLTLAHRFELDSYHAVLALVAGGAGWTILTPLALMRARSLAEGLDVMPLPLAPLSRTISLIARREVLGEIPGQMAATLQGLVRREIAAPAIAAYPWMAEALQVHGDPDAPGLPAAQVP